MADAVTVELPSRKVLGSVRMKLRVVAASLFVLGLGALTAPRADQPSVLTTPEERAAPLLEAELERRESLRAFERLQEMGGRVLGYAVSVPFPVPTLPRTVRDFGEGRSRLAMPLGLGVVVTADGQVLTHAAGLPDVLTFPVQTQTGVNVDATVVGFDAATGLALLSLSGVADSPVAPLSARRVGAGALATAAGRWADVDMIAPVFVTVAGNDEYGIGTSGSALPPGTPLYDAEGELFAVAGVGGLAYPAREAVDRLATQVREGRGHRSSISVAFQAFEPGLDRWFGEQGALVADAALGGPAERAGIRAGDVLTAVGEEPVASLQDARRLIEILPQGTESVLRVRRGQVDVQIMVTPITVFEGRSAFARARRGSDTSPLARDVIPAARLAETDFDADLRLLSVELQPVGSPREVERALRRAQGDALLYVELQSERFFAVLPSGAR